MTRRVAFADLPHELMDAHKQALAPSGYRVACPDRKIALSLQRRLQRFAWRAAAEGPVHLRAVPVWRVVEHHAKNGRKWWDLVGERAAPVKAKRVDEVLALLRGDGT